MELPDLEDVVIPLTVLKYSVILEYEYDIVKNRAKLVRQFVKNQTEKVAAPTPTVDMRANTKVTEI